MKMRSLLLVSAALLIFSCAIAASGSSPDQLALEAVSNDNAAAQAAIRQLRSMGQPGLDTLIAKYKADIERYARTGESDDKWKRIAAAIDTVAMQRDAYASDLYWYTDLDEAKTRRPRPT